MKIIRMEATEAGGYQIQYGASSIPEGCAFVPEELDLAEFYEFKGFITPEFQHVPETDENPAYDVMLGYDGNQAALDAWNAAHPIPDPLREAREQKLAEISAACKGAIENGKDITLSDGNVYHFDYSIEDQSNIASMWNAVTAGATCYPYHAKDGNCTVYPAVDIITIYMSLAGLQTAQTTYHNQLKAMLLTLESVEEIEAVTYGQPLEGTYLATYNEMIQTAQEQMNAILKRMAALAEAENA